MKELYLDLNKLNIPKLYVFDPKKYLASGWFKVSNAIKYKYEKDSHIFHINVPQDLKSFSIDFVPYTTGKYEEEEKYRLEVNLDEQKCNVYYQATKYVDYMLRWRLLNVYNL
jgi:hypothetical protein